MTDRDLKQVLNLQGIAALAAKASFVTALINRAKLESRMCHFLALETIEHLLSKFDESDVGHMVVVRDFFGAFWQELELEAEKIARESLQESIAWHGAAMAFKLISEETKALVASLNDPLKTPTLPEFLAALRSLKEVFEDSPGRTRIWREVFEEKFGKLT